MEEASRRSLGNLDRGVDIREKVLMSAAKQGYLYKQEPEELG